MKPGYGRSGWCLFTALVLSLAVFGGSRAQAQTFSIVHAFLGGDDGGNAMNGLVAASGNLYGTTSAGGASGNNGVVYKINPDSGAESVLYAFAGQPDGASPESALLLYSDHLYGTTTAGGASNAGTVFEISLKGQETVLYSFTGGADGADPQATLVKDSAGNLYGTTFAGGANGNGTVFELVRPAGSGSWTEQVLYSFGTGTDGANPVAGVAFDKAGNLYGTTSAGGTYGYGTVFELSPSASGWTENILHEFALQDDGGVPYAGVVVNSAGDLYGTATDGGQGGSSGGGTVFEMTPSSTGWNFKVLYGLDGWGISGSWRAPLLVSDKIYATTHCDGANSAGTIYELSLSKGVWEYTQLYTFSGGNDGLYSISTLLDHGGYLWGIATYNGPDDYGVVFKITP